MFNAAQYGNRHRTRAEILESLQKRIRALLTLAEDQIDQRGDSLAEREYDDLNAILEDHRLQLLKLLGELRHA